MISSPLTHDQPKTRTGREYLSDKNTSLSASEGDIPLEAGSSSSSSTAGSAMTQRHTFSIRNITDSQTAATGRRSTTQLPGNASTRLRPSLGLLRSPTTKLRGEEASSRHVCMRLRQAGSDCWTGPKSTKPEAPEAPGSKEPWGSGASV